VAERLVRTVRRELLDHIIVLDDRLSFARTSSGRRLENR
jgi:hypothetical protein